MTNFPIADTGRRMGRPPLKLDAQTKPTMVRLTADIRARIEALSGKHRMAEFIRAAVLEKLERDERRPG